MSSASSSAPAPSPAPAPGPSPSASASASASPAPSPSPSASPSPSPQPSPSPSPSPTPSASPEPSPSPSPSPEPPASSASSSSAAATPTPPPTASSTSASPVLGTPVATQSVPPSASASTLPPGVNVRPANGGNVATIDPTGGSSANSAGGDSASDGGMSAGAVTALVIVPLALAGVLLGLFVARWRRTQRRRQFASVPMSMLHARNVDGGGAGAANNNSAAAGGLPTVKPFAPTPATMLPPASGQPSTSMAGTMVYVPIAEPKTADRQQQQQPQEYVQEYEYQQHDTMGYPQQQQGMYAPVSQHHMQPMLSSYDADEVQFPTSTPLPAPMPTASAVAPIVPTSGPFAPRHVPIGPLGQGYTGPTTPGAHAVIPATAAADLPPLPPHMQPVPQQMPQSVAYRAGPMQRQGSLEGQDELATPMAGVVQPVSPGYGPSSQQ